MRTLRAAAIAVACFTAMAGCPARASVVLYQQPPAPGDNSWFSDTSIVQQLADDFQLPGPNTTITDLHWWGVYDDVPPNQVPAADSFTIRFLDSIAGAGNIILQEVAGSVSRTLTGLISAPDGSTGLPNDVYYYQYNLATPLTVPANTTRYVSIVNNTPSAPWAWYESFGVGDGNFFFRGTDVNAWAQTSPGLSSDLAFQITGVPEPATLGFLACGMIGVLRRRKRAV